jgi:hypothetical protein
MRGLTDVVNVKNKPLSKFSVARDKLLYDIQTVRHR